jgi:hypothetical protein
MTVREKAEEVLKYAGGVLEDDATEFLENSVALAKAYLQEHPSDDEEPVSSEWLDEYFKPWRARSQRGWELIATCIIRETNCGFSPVFSHTGQGSCGAILKTRRDVRRLCKVLGIEIRE